VPVPRDGFGPDVIEPTRVEWPIGGWAPTSPRPWLSSPAAATGCRNEAGRAW